MKANDLDNIVRNNLSTVLDAMEMQHGLSAEYPATVMSFLEQMSQIREYISVAGEYGLAYECIVANLESIPYVLSGLQAIKLLEVGLLMGFKTESPDDVVFDRRNP